MELKVHSACAFIATLVLLLTKIALPATIPARSATQQQEAVVYSATLLPSDILMPVKLHAYATMDTMTTIPLSFANSAMWPVLYAQLAFPTLAQPAALFTIS